ncbi:MAG TPA: hypothetical protein VMF89_12405, partial [Polyangiales bacterium]|nr:hypothetical protein [Polyangiales bacterium]
IDNVAVTLPLVRRIAHKHAAAGVKPTTRSRRSSTCSCRLRTVSFTPLSAAAADKPIALLCAGIGITPLLSVLNTLAHAGSTARRCLPSLLEHLA